MRFSRAARVWLAFLVTAAAFVFLSVQDTSAQSDVELSGWLWSGNSGWISVNCADRNICDPNYKVILKSGGELDGLAWSGSLGWIKFGGLSGFPLGAGTVSANARQTSAGNGFEGWARACGATIQRDCVSATDAAAGGWDGWFSLKGSDINNNTTYQVTYDSVTGQFGGYAWGGLNMGWLSFDAVAARPAERFAYTVQAVNPEITINKNATLSGSNTITVALLSGTAQSVRLTASGESGFSYTWANQSCTPNSGSNPAVCSPSPVLTVTIQSGVPVGSYAVSVSGDPPPVSSTAFSVKVIDSTSPPPPPPPPPPDSVFCQPHASPTGPALSAQRVGSPVYWRVLSIDGNPVSESAPYAYRWTGTDIAGTGSGNPFVKVYSTIGLKSANVEVFSGSTPLGSGSCAVRISNRPIFIEQ
ncbi:MAG: hypothetical protein HYT43_01250 [Candidatus Taylorbacteria bacterium]|nr:hypothetical protein [Candidatus Taylorbacteria bacterium]